MKHILLVSQYFYPETFRINDMAVEWVKRGYKVTVLTGIPNYPMGKYFQGYDRKHRRRETWNGIDIIRIPLIPRGNSSNKIINTLGMVANYLSFIASGRRWVRKNNIGADLVFTVEVSPMTQALIGMWYGKRYHVPTYLYVQDLWPENVQTVTGIHSKIIIGPINKMVDKIYHETDQIFTTSPSFVEAIVNRSVPVAREKVHYWPQYFEEFYIPLSFLDGKNNLKEAGLEWIYNQIPRDYFNIAFTGNIGKAQGLDILPMVAVRLKEYKELEGYQGLHTKPIHFVIVGDGRYQEKLQIEIENKCVTDMFTFITRQAAEIIPSILALCEVAFLSFSEDKLWEMTIPAKLQSYMACGMPIIASAAGETKRIINEAECGICCLIGDVEDIATVISKICRLDLMEMRRNGRLYAEKHFDKKMLMDEMNNRIKRQIGE